MPEQHARYIKRGELGVKNGDYSAFYVFMVCSRKYYDVNSEAKAYENHVFYEDCLEYLQAKDEPLSKVWAQQFRQAIDKAKHTSETTINEAANRFFRQYKKYQTEHYPELELRTSENANGWWTLFILIAENCT